MKKINNLVLICLLLLCVTSFSQEQAAITMYKYHMNLFNPAYVGMDNEALVTSTIRKQWTGIKDAPATQTVSLGTPVAKNVGFGISMIHSSTFIESQTNIAIDLSYKLKLNTDMDLYMGVKAGGNNYKINASGLETYNVTSDPTLQSISVFQPNVGIGAVLRTKKWYASLAVPKLLNSDKSTYKRTYNGNSYVTTATERPHFYLSGGYDLDLSPSLVLKPSMFLRYVNGSPVSLDVNTMLNFEEKIELGATYRTDDAYALMSTIILSQRLMIGYAYEMSTKSTLARARNTNEFLMRFKF